MKINDVVFTNHAITRMQERGISGEWAWATVKKADKTQPGKERHTTEFIKKFTSHTVTVIGRKNDIGEWVVFSVWMDPPLVGTADYRNRQKYLNKFERNKTLDRKIKKASFWGKLWLIFRKQLGL